MLLLQSIFCQKTVVNKYIHNNENNVIMRYIFSPHHMLIVFDFQRNYVFPLTPCSVVLKVFLSTAHRLLGTLFPYFIRLWLWNYFPFLTEVKVTFKKKVKILYILENPMHFLLHCLIITVSYVLYYDFHQPELKQGTFSTLWL